MASFTRLDTLSMVSCMVADVVLTVSESESRIWSMRSRARSTFERSSSLLASKEGRMLSTLLPSVAAPCS
jgi:hypothetical protein